VPDIFLSYSRDDQARARIFADAFRAEGFDVWWDVGLKSGEAYDVVTETALREAKAVVVLWSARSVASNWVRAEASIGQEHTCLVPVKIEPCELPVMFRLMQTAELLRWKGDAADPAWLAFVGDVRRIVERDGGAAPKAAGAPAAKRALSRRTMMIAGGAGLAVAAGAAVVLWPKGGVSAGEKTGATLAVLPFDNLSADPANAFMADGLAEEVLNGLQRVKGLRVIARTSSFALREETLSAQQIGSKLGADVLVQGSVRQAGADVRVAAQLVDARNGEQLWSQTFQKTVDDLFALQDAVTAALVAELPRVLGVSGLTRVARKPVDPATFRNMLEANELRQQASNLRQVGRLEEADAHYVRINEIIQEELRKNPDNGDVLAFQAALLIGRANPLFWDGPPREGMVTARALLARVLAADPDNVEACVLQAEIYSRFDYRWREAEELLLHALSVNSNSENAYTQLGYHYSKVGRAVEAIPEAEIGYRLDPQSAFRRSSVARLMSTAGRGEEGIAMFREYAFSGEVNLIAARDLFYALMETRDVAGMDDVVARLEKVRKIVDLSALINRMQAVLEGMKGRPERHRRLADEFFASMKPDQLWQNQTLWFLTVEAAAMGDIDRALDGFELSMRNEILYQAQWFPYGAPVPEALARHPRWMAMWTADPRLKELLDLRLDALKRRQFFGRLPDGMLVTPA
jgi:TolB-like protein